MEIIIRKSGSFGRTRSEQESNLRKEWGPTMNDEQLSKVKFIEKKAKESTGSGSNFVQQVDTEKVK
jgi:hypothetical protein